MEQLLEVKSKQDLHHISIEDLTLLALEAEDLEARFHVGQLAEKTAINSLYGAIGNVGFSLFNEEIARAITGAGRYFIKCVAKDLEECLQFIKPSKIPYIIYGDTDSFYYQIKEFVEEFINENPTLPLAEYVKFADTFEKEIVQKSIQCSIEIYCRRFNVFRPDVIKIEREIIADRAIFIAKKKYFARVRDLEGTSYPEDDPYWKVLGLEFENSGACKFAKTKFKEIMGILLDGDEAQLKNFVAKCKDEFFSLPIKDVVSYAGVQEMDYELGQKGIPIGARSVLVHNNYVQKYNLNEKFELIQPGEKTRRMWLNVPNVFESDVIGYTNDEFSYEIEKHGCADYERAFQKNFVNPLQIMAKSLGIDITKNTLSLFDF